MPKSRAAIFNEHLPPKITDAHIEQLGDGIAVMSFDTLPLVADPRSSSFLAVRFALADKSEVTVLMDRFACDLLRGVVDRLNSVDWDVARLKGPAGPRPN
jgi:hypothetical protein